VNPLPSGRDRWLDKTSDGSSVWDLPSLTGHSGHSEARIHCIALQRPWPGRKLLEFWHPHGERTETDEVVST
jgi:hypothetical protein